MRCTAALLMLLAAPACTVTIPPPDVDITSADPHRSWARVLDRHVDDAGRIDFAALREDSRDLDVYVKWLSTHGPDPDPAQKLVYYINGYNALAMYNVLHAGVLPVDTVTFFYLRSLQLDNEYIDLYTLENDLIRLRRELGRAEQRAHAVPRRRRAPIIASVVASPSPSGPS